MARLREGGCEVVAVPEAHRLDEDALCAAVAPADAIVAGSERLTARVLGAAPRLKIVARPGVGYDAVDVAAATRLGIVVTNAPGSNTVAVAEHTLGLMLALLRRTIPTHDAVASGRWQRSPSTQLSGKTLGIVGLGNIGKQVAIRARAFAMAVVATDPVRDEGFAAAHGVRYVALDELLRSADLVTLHVPLDATTRHLVDRRALALMKPSAYLINCARGGVVDEEALLEALRARCIAGAGLDVFAVEPLPDARFGGFDNVVLSPHVAGYSEEAIATMAEDGAAAVLAVLRGERPRGIVNPEVWERRRA